MKAVSCLYFRPNAQGDWVSNTNDKMKNDNTTLLFNSCFVDDEDIEYAYKHRINVLYTYTICTNTFVDSAFSR